LAFREDFFHVGDDADDDLTGASVLRAALDELDRLRDRTSARREPGIERFPNVVNRARISNGAEV
jgi:hypothetical protein